MYYLEIITIMSESMFDYTLKNCVSYVVANFRKILTGKKQDSVNTLFHNKDVVKCKNLNKN